MTQFFPGMKAVAERYEAVILDLWGVVHDGANAFPRSAETLRHLKDAGCRVMLLSNAPRRGYALLDQMERLGIARELCGEVMSSGEAVHQALKDRTEEGFTNLGNKVYHLGPERDHSVFDGLPLQKVGIAEADFIVNTGPDKDGETLALFEDVLQQGAARQLPMICANPDRWIIRRGQRVMCAGVIADRYLELGGQVTWRGKPDPAIYRLCLTRLGIDPTRVAVIGDALETDMQGAANVGLDGIWVTGGLHAEDLDGGYDKPADPSKVIALSRAAGLTPTAAIPSFIW